jgi:hypothetical protein
VDLLGRGRGLVRAKPSSRAMRLSCSWMSSHSRIRGSTRGSCRGTARQSGCLSSFRCLLPEAPQLEVDRRSRCPRRLEAAVGLVGPLLRGERPLAWILQAERGGDQEHSRAALARLAGEDHPAHPRVERQLRELLPIVGERAVGRRGRRAPPARGSPRRSRAWTAGRGTGNSRRSPRSSAFMRRMTPARPTRLISGSVYTGARVSSSLVAEADADAGRAAAAALALVGAGREMAST